MDSDQNQWLRWLMRLYAGHTLDAEHVMKHIAARMSFNATSMGMSLNDKKQHLWQGVWIFLSVYGHVLKR